MNHRVTTTYDRHIPSSNHHSKWLCHLIPQPHFNSSTRRSVTTNENDTNDNGDTRRLIPGTIPIVLPSPFGHATTSHTNRSCSDTNEELGGNIIIGRMEIIPSIVTACRYYAHLHGTEKDHPTKKNDTCLECRNWTEYGARYLSKQMLRFTCERVPLHQNEHSQDDLQTKNRGALCRFIMESCGKNVFQFMLLNGRTLSTWTSNKSSDSDNHIHNMTMNHQIHLQDQDEIRFIVPKDGIRTVGCNEDTNKNRIDPNSFLQLAFCISIQEHPHQSQPLHSLESDKYENESDRKRRVMYDMDENRDKKEDEEEEESPFLSMHHFSASFDSGHGTNPSQQYHPLHQVDQQQREESIPTSDHFGCMDSSSQYVSTHSQHVDPVGNQKILLSTLSASELKTLYDDFMFISSGTDQKKENQYVASMVDTKNEPKQNTHHPTSISSTIASWNRKRKMTLGLLACATHVKKRMEQFSEETSKQDRSLDTDMTVFSFPPLLKRIRLHRK